MRRYRLATWIDVDRAARAELVVAASPLGPGRVTWTKGSPWQDARGLLSHRGCEFITDEATLDRDGLTEFWAGVLGPLLPTEVEDAPEAGLRATRWDANGHVIAALVVMWIEEGGQRMDITTSDEWAVQLGLSVHDEPLEVT
jgi:hypothetical protein